MGTPKTHRRIALIAVLGLFLGQGTALHHQHEIVADCPEACLDHDQHDGVATTAPASISEADACPACEIIGQARAPLPSAIAEAAPRTAEAVRLAAVRTGLARSAPSALLRARAPPASA